MKVDAIQFAILTLGFIGGAYLANRYLKIKYRVDYWMYLGVVLLLFFVTQPFLRVVGFEGFSIYGVFLTQWLQAKYLGAGLCLTIKHMLG